jgi:hypothetical protein
VQDQHRLAARRADGGVVQLQLRQYFAGMEAEVVPSARVMTADFMGTLLRWWVPECYAWGRLSWARRQPTSPTA